jgi:ABC-type nitrate/sulfonate/bicarbonate transport system permease component
MTSTSQRPLSKVETLILSTTGLAAFLGLWLAASTSGYVPRQFLPTPLEVFARAIHLLTVPFAGATLPMHLARSLERYAYGVALAGSVGVPLGLAMGWYRWLDDIVTPVFDGLRFIAPIAWVPFAALWFGTGLGGPIMIIFSGAFPPCLISAYRGARFVDHKYIEAAQMLGTNNLRMIAEVLLPAAFPSIVAGLRVGAGLGWQSLVGAELIVASAGVGYMMVQGQSNISAPTVMAGMLAIGMVGLLIDVALRQMETHVRRRRGLA